MKMKAILLFLVMFLAGFAIILSYQYLLPKQFHFPSIKPAVTTKFSLANAPSQTLRGTITIITGKVAWLSRTANKPVIITAPRTIQQGEDLITGSNGNVSITIHNLAFLALSPNTHISFIELLPQNFVINQVKGSVLYENSISVPVSIVTNDLLTIENNGVVSITMEPNSTIISIKVEKGYVTEGYEDLQDNSNVVPLTQGQTFIFDTKAQQGTVE
jgi:hypothetical protein